MSEPLFSEFQEFRKILCICPCCCKLSRLSDLHIHSKGKTASTWLDAHEKESTKLAMKEDAFEEEKGKLRDIAQQKGRLEAETAFNNAILPSFKELKLNPLDVIPILNPIDFIVFKGMSNEETISDIVFLSKEYDSAPLLKIREQVKRVIKDKKYDWQLARIDEFCNVEYDNQKRLTCLK